MPLKPVSQKMPCCLYLHTATHTSTKKTFVNIVIKDFSLYLSQSIAFSNFLANENT